MTITEKDIDGAAAKELRERLGLTQAAFWEPVGVKQSVGCRHEKGVPILQSVRILIVARYICGLHIDASSIDSIEDLKELAEVQKKTLQAKSIARAIQSDIHKAVKSLSAAHDTLSNV